LRITGKAIIDRYRKQYIDMRFERNGLFELIRDEFHPVEVIYPGCSVHITPALFFPYVVFVDRDPATIEFFSEFESVLDFVRQHRRYSQTPFIQFIPQDFTKPLPLRIGQFDLLLSIFTEGVSRACKCYLKTGGVLITNNHRNDAMEAVQDEELELIGVIEKTHREYRLRGAQPGEPLPQDKLQKRSKRYLKSSSNGGLEYIDNESYYVFKKARRPK
jgi:hypothetical protein